MKDDETPLRKFRRDACKTQVEIATAVGVTDSQFSRIEREGTASLPMAMKLADITGLPERAFAKTDPEA